MDVDSVAKTIESFANRHQLTFERLGSRQTQVLELAAVVGVSQHYSASGFKVTVINPRGGGDFVVKSGTRGHPADYSRFHCERNGDEVELHANLLVQGAHDGGTYCVDVGIVNAGEVPDRKGLVKWERLANGHLRSFAEVKKLVVYPMLLAQFLGIVHEITPAFLQQPGPVPFGSGQHLPPTLISLGHYSANSQLIVEGFSHRGFSFHVVPSFDIRLAWSRSDATRSPFFGAPDDSDDSVPF